jgi:hypothetical protein
VAQKLGLHTSEFFKKRRKVKYHPKIVQSGHPGSACQWFWKASIKVMSATLGNLQQRLAPSNKGLIPDRVARWYVSNPKIQIWVNFGVPWNEKVGMFYGNLEYSANIWYILWPFGM